MAKASATLECPVCSDIYTNPKLLGCNHIVCGKCITDWLEKTKGSGGCPLCRAPIMSPSPSPSASRHQLEELVDSLPTDLTIMAKVANLKLLSSRHVCMYCDNNTPASSFCLQCSMKLCKACVKGHKKIPSLKNHDIEQLDSLTSERLAEVTRSCCKTHEDRLAELYCCDHQELMCTVCATSSHRGCSEVMAIREAAMEKREHLRREAQRLREEEARMKAKTEKQKARLAVMRAKANRKFDDLRRCVERRCQEVNDLIQAEEEQLALPQQNHVRAAALSQAAVLDSLVGEAPDDALLDMGKAMTSRLHDLQQQAAATDLVQGPADVTVDSQKLTEVTSAIAKLGTRSARSQPPPPRPPPSPSGTKPRGTALARVLKKGDRVKLNPDLPCWNSKDRERRGTVTAVPSRRMVSWGEDPSGKVDVLWDDGDEWCYDMGRRGHYDLDLA
ncbi:uncharacterized protein LOC143287950 [Babylonia areolata]|uniref:uncharacterized protein LOC143287950 n=1 Tax=Babylonia areolata TaxID=304850 RepID=UPI003FD472B5